MPSLRDIRNRIGSIKSTGKITRAMQMVAAAKLRKSQVAMENARPYSDMLAKMLRYVTGGVEKEEYPLLSVRPVKTVELIVVAGDKGLCGAFNTNVFKETLKRIGNFKAKGINYRLTVVGKRMNDFLRRMGYESRYSLIDISRELAYSEIIDLAEDIIEDYAKEKIDEVCIISNRFVSISVQSTEVKTLLPFELNDSQKDGSSNDVITGAEDTGQSEDDVSMFLFEPSEGAILNQLLPKCVDNAIYLAVLESRAAEEAARMMAMQNATNNTKEMTGKLTLQYNKARQASITTELIDIVSGANAISN